MTYNTSFMLELVSHPNSISEIEPYISRVIENYHVGDELYGNMLISLTEAVNNAIIHGNDNDTSKTVVVQLLQNEKQIAFHVRDEGNGFNPESLPDPTAPENLLKEGGRGIFLMQQLSDGVEFHDDGRTVALKFNINDVN